VGADRRAARARRAGLALGVALLLAGVSCGGGGSGAPPPTATPAAAPSPTAGLPVTGDPGITVSNVVQACREKDADRLRSFVAGDVGLSDIAALFARGSEVVLKVQSLPDLAEGQDEVSIDVQLEIRRDGSTEDVARTWDLVLGDDGVWRLTELPDCY